MKQTRRDKQIMRAAMRFMVRQYRNAPTQNTALNIGRLFAARRSVAYDHSPIPCPIWIGYSH